MEGGAAAAAAGTVLVDRSRWARRAIARHASGTLHLLPATRPVAGSATPCSGGAFEAASHGAAGPQAAAEAGAAGVAAGGEAAGGTGATCTGPPQSLSQLHVEVTRGLPSGDDGAVVFSGCVGRGEKRCVVGRESCSWDWAAKMGRGDVVAGGQLAQAPVAGVGKS